MKQLKTDFRRDGYVALRGFLNPADCADIHTNLERFIRDVVPTMPPETVYLEDPNDPSTLKQLQQMAQYDAFFRAHFDGRFKDVAAVLLEDGAQGKNMQFFNKPPFVGQPTPAHQDGYYFMLKPCEAVTMWLALEDVDHETGCIHYSRGSHERGMRPHGKTKTLGFSQGITDFPNDDDRANVVAFPAKAGDLLVHHGLTVHWASGNSSITRTRKALGFIYYADGAQQDAAAHAAYQARLAADLKNEGKV